MKPLAVTLAIPLLSLSVIAFVINSYVPPGGMLSSVLINIATELVGIVVTVFYVDWTIKSHEIEKWRRADERIAERLRTLLNTVVSNMRGGLKISDKVLRIGKADPYLIHRDVIRVGLEVISPLSEGIIESLDSSGWKRLSERFSEARGAVTEFLQFFQARVNPDQFADLLELHDELSRGLTMYHVFPDVVGIELNKIDQQKQVQAQAIQTQAIESAVKAVRNICRIAERISQTVEK